MPIMAHEYRYDIRISVKIPAKIPAVMVTIAPTKIHGDCQWIGFKGKFRGNPHFFHGQNPGFRLRFSLNPMTVETGGWLGLFLIHQKRAKSIGFSRIPLPAGGLPSCEEGLCRKPFFFPRSKHRETMGDWNFSQPLTH